MDEIATQAKLSAGQVQAFYHDEFVIDQVRDFRELVGERGSEQVVDVGGGCGFFAHRLRAIGGYPTRVIDMDPTSIDQCRALGLDAEIGDALDPEVRGDEDVICFNLILHHLVGENERKNRALQLRALRAWHASGAMVFVNEYIYQSVIGRTSPRLIYEVTSSRALSKLGQMASRWLPSLRANTFNVGVRFRSHEDWLELFAEGGFRVVAKRLGEPEPVSLPRRALLIETIRRDSFLLESVHSEPYKMRSRRRRLQGATSG